MPQAVGIAFADCTKIGEFGTRQYPVQRLVGFICANTRAQDQAGLAVAGGYIHIRVGLERVFDADIAQRTRHHASRDIAPADQCDQFAHATLAGGMPRRLPNAGQQFEEHTRARPRRQGGDRIGDHLDVLVIEAQERLGLGFTPQCLAQRSHAGVSALHRVDAEVDEHHRNARLGQHIGDRTVFGGAVTGNAEHCQVRFQRKDFLGADALFRRLPDQRDVFHYGKFRHVGVVGVLVEQAQIILPADDALEGRVLVQQRKRRNQPAFT